MGRWGREGRGRKEGRELGVSGVGWGGAGRGWEVGGGGAHLGRHLGGRGVACAQKLPYAYRAGDAEREWEGEEGEGDDVAQRDVRVERDRAEVAGEEGHQLESPCLQPEHERAGAAEPHEGLDARGDAGVEAGPRHRGGRKRQLGPRRRLQRRVWRRPRAAEPQPADPPPPPRAAALVAAVEAEREALREPRGRGRDRRAVDAEAEPIDEEPVEERVEDVGAERDRHRGRQHRLRLQVLRQAGEDGERDDARDEVEAVLARVGGERGVLPERAQNRSGRGEEERVRHAEDRHHHEPGLRPTRERGHLPRAVRLRQQRV